MVDFANGRRSPVWLRVASGRRLTHNLTAYFAAVTARERALLDLVEEPVLDVGCGPARHARLLQARGRLCCSCCDRASSRQTVAMRIRPTPIARSAFAGFCFPPDVIVLAVRWYLRFALSYRDVEELLAERGIQVDHVTIYRWLPLGPALHGPAGRGRPALSPRCR
jgi:hypothetical protein